jgi:hypothetical protein
MVGGYPRTMSEKQSSRKVTPETFLGGAFYLIALGAGVLIGSLVALIFLVVGTLLLGLAASGTVTVQRRVPALGRLPLVPDQGFRVVPAAAWDRQRSELRAASSQQEEHVTAGRSEARLTFEDLKPRVEKHLEEARQMYEELSDRPPVDRIGALYDQAVNWQARVVTDLERYQAALAEDFRHGGNILSPQLPSVHPTDCANIQVAVERRGRALRNLLDGTPGKDLEWGSVSYF